MTAAEWESLAPAVEAAARRLLAELPACHDWDHTLRVRHLALQLCGTEGGDRAVVEASALLHDVGRGQELHDQGKTCHASLGATMVPAILLGCGVGDETFVARVAAAVGSHRYRRRSGGAPASLEARIVFDADKLDSLGCIGLARAFHFAGRIGARVHNTAAEATASASYSGEDTAYREFLVKLRHLPGSLLTAGGRALAAGRFAGMQAFFRQLNRECGLPETDGEAESHNAGSP